MIIYKQIYPFEVIKELGNMVCVRVLDKQCDHVSAMETLTVFEAFEYIKLAEKMPDRFLFYAKVNKEDDENV